MLWLSAAVWLAACGAKVTTYHVTVVDAACSGPSPLGSGATTVDSFRFTVTGDNMAPIVVKASYGSHSASVGNIPAGGNRVIEVRAYAGTTLVSLGRTVPFAVPDTVPETNTAVDVTVFLRPVGQFTQPNVAATPNTCAHMTVARAGHSATVLNDGRVFIAGGYQVDVSGHPTATQTTEYYDPATGLFSAGPDIVLATGGGPDGGAFQSFPRAFHTAAMLTNGWVFLVGGEDYQDGGAVPQASNIIFVPDYFKYAGSPPYGTLPLNQPRSHAGVAVDAAGRVLVVGGYTYSGQVADQVEWYDPSSWTTAPQSYVVTAPCDGGLPDGTDAGCPWSFPRAGMAMSAVQSGKYIAVAAGTDGTGLHTDVNFFSFGPSSFQASTQAVTLAQARREAGIAPFADLSQLILIGGYDTPSDSVGYGSVNTSEVISTSQRFQVGPGPLVGQRGRACATRLLDGRVFSVGGRVSDLTGAPVSDGTVELIAPGSGVPTTLGQAPLAVPRWAHTCTTLNDGSVLVLGGVEEAGGQQTILQDALIYMPQPLN